MIPLSVRLMEGLSYSISSGHSYIYIYFFFAQGTFRAAGGGEEDGSSQVPLHLARVRHLRGPSGPCHGIHGDRFPGEPPGHRATALGAQVPHHPRDGGGNELLALYETPTAPPGPEARQHSSGCSLSCQGGAFLPF